MAQVNEQQTKSRTILKNEVTINTKDVNYGQATTLDAVKSSEL